MTTVYAESSAVLAWLLGEPAQDTIIHALDAADHVVASALTALECRRGLLRARLDRRISAAQERTVARILDDALAAWFLLDITDEVLNAASEEMPDEPVRTLDAIHIASAQVLHAEIGELGELEVLSLDDRVRRNALALGMRVVPSRGG